MAFLERGTGSIDATTLLGLIEAGCAPVIVDVRSPGEFEVGHVPGARNMPFWVVGVRARDLSAHRDDPVVVYCGNGPRARAAIFAFRIRGFRWLIDLEGQWDGWRDGGHPQEAVDGR